MALSQDVRVNASALRLSQLVDPNLMLARKLLWPVHLEIEIEGHFIGDLAVQLISHPMRTLATDVLYQYRRNSPPQLVIRVRIILKKRIHSGMRISRIAIERQQILDDPLLGEHKALTTAAVFRHETDAELQWDHAATAAGEEEADQAGCADTTGEDDVYEWHRFADDRIAPPQDEDECELTENEKSAEAEVAGPLLAVPA